MTPSDLTQRLKEHARGLGFDLVGVCPAISLPANDRLREWLANGYHGEMNYLETRADAYQDPNSVLSGVRSVVMLAINYRTKEPVAPPPGFGRVSRYAWGTDYHDLIRQRLQQLADFLRSLSPDAEIRGVVDTAPLLEREYAQLAGLGWIGKNTLLLNTQAGSWFFLAALLTSCELTPDEPQSVDHCGTCRACLDACPTEAFVAPYVLDARKCISYLTIELRSSIPTELRSGIGDWLFGCDVCQDVCPWNRKAPLSRETAFEPRETTNPIDLMELFDLSDEAFRDRFRHTPLWRAKRRGLLRNAAIVLGNHPTPRARAALTRGLSDIEPLVREACEWSLAQMEKETASD